MDSEDAKKNIWPKETAQFPRATSKTRMSIEALGRDDREPHAKSFTQKETHDSFHGLQTCLPSWDLSSIKIRSKVIFSNCVDVKTNIIMLYVKVFYLIQKFTFFF